MKTPKGIAASSQSVPTMKKTVSGARRRLRCSSGVGARSSFSQRRLGRRRRNAHAIPSGIEQRDVGRGEDQVEDDEPPSSPSGGRTQTRSTKTIAVPARFATAIAAAVSQRTARITV